MGTMLRIALVAATACVADGRLVVRRGCGYGASVYAPPVAYQQVYPVAGWQFSVGAERLGEERLRKVEEAIIIQQQLNAQLARIVSSGGAGNVSQSEVAVRRVFATNCLKCHSGSGAKAGMDLTIPTFSVFDKALVSQMVASGQMPPPDSGIELSKEDANTIQDWAYESADEFRKELRRLRQQNGGGNGTPPAPVPALPRPGNGAH